MSTRAERRDTTEAAILAAGLRLLAEGGSDALTVRGLARELGLAPSGLYRYVRSRDDLLNLLLRHAHNELADEIEAAQAALPETDLRGRWRAFAYTMRDWSMAHRHEWVLIQRSVVAGPQPVDEHTFRLHEILLRLGAAGEAAGLHPVVSLPHGGSAIPGLPGMLALAGVQVSEQTALAGLAAWHLLDGAIYAELLRLAGMELVDAEVYYAAMVSATELLIFGPPPPELDVRRTAAG